jgi:hypothetical protein
MDTSAIVHPNESYILVVCPDMGDTASHAILRSNMILKTHGFIAVYPVENGPRHSRSDAAECS